MLFVLLFLLNKPPKTIDRANRQGPTQATTFEGPLCTGWSLRIGACPVPKLFFHTKNMYHLISFLPLRITKTPVSLSKPRVSRVSRESGHLWSILALGKSVVFWCENSSKQHRIDRTAFHQIALCGRRSTSKVDLISRHGPRMFHPDPESAWFKDVQREGSPHLLGKHRCGEIGEPQYRSDWFKGNLECEDVGKNKRYSYGHMAPPNHSSSLSSFNSPRGPMWSYHELTAFFG